MTDDGKMYQFMNKEYISLETYKRSGRGVSTPVWFVIDSDKIFVRSYANSGKVKRMRNNSNVEVTLRMLSAGLMDSPSKARPSVWTEMVRSASAASLSQIRPDEDVL
ncbi:MAG TPA: hypothetical protein VLY86_01300 [Methanothrix sp.]|nr:hypothetical protein [Methanothrix sp.]